MNSAEAVTTEIVNLSIRTTQSVGICLPEIMTIHRWLGLTGLTLMPGPWTQSAIRFIGCAMSFLQTCIVSIALYNGIMRLATRAHTMRTTSCSIQASDFSSSTKSHGPRVIGIVAKLEERLEKSSGTAQISLWSTKEIPLQSLVARARVRTLANHGVRQTAILGQLGAHGVDAQVALSVVRTCLHRWRQ